MNKENPCRFGELSTEQLDDLLHTELGKEKKDRTTILEILRILEEREADKPVELTEEVVSAWENYQNAQKRESTAVKKHSLWITKVAAVFVAVSILVISIPAAAGLGFFEAIAQWTEDIFKFTGTPTKTEVPEDYVFETDNPDLQKVYDAVCEMGIEQPVVPTWIPEIYRLGEIERFQNVSGFLVAKFVSHNGELIIYIRNTEENIVDITKNEKIVRKYTKNAVDHYVIENENEIKVAWMSAKYVVTISCTSKDLQIEKLINSIYG